MVTRGFRVIISNLSNYLPDFDVRSWVEFESSLLDIEFVDDDGFLDEAYHCLGLIINREELHSLVHQELSSLTDEELLLRYCYVESDLRLLGLASSYDREAYLRHRDYICMAKGELQGLQIEAALRWAVQ